MVEFGLIIVEDVCDNLSLAVIQTGLAVCTRTHTRIQYKQKERAKLSRIEKEVEAVIEEWEAGRSEREQVKDERNPIAETVTSMGLKAE